MGRRNLEKARLLAMCIMILAAKSVSDSDKQSQNNFGVSLLKRIAGCQGFS